MELPGAPYRFDRFVLDVLNLRLTANGEICPLEPKSFRLLQFLIENRHRAVPKEELLTVVWEGVAVSDNALTRAVAQIRKALDDDPKQPRFIETIPTVGYRFAAAVQTDPAPAPVVAQPPAAPPQRRHSRFALWGLAAAALLATAAGAVRYLRTDPPPSPPVPFTSYPGTEVNPTFSPDGNQIAFAWNGPKGDNFDIYIKAVGSENPLRLTTNPVKDDMPRWSPDGTAIAFERLLPGAAVEILLISPLGGPERKLTTVVYHEAEVLSVQTAPQLSWSPDGKWLAVSGDHAADGKDRILLISAETGEVRPLTNPPENDLRDDRPAFSPDGASLAFLRAHPGVGGTVYLLPLDRNYAPAGDLRTLPGGDLRPLQLLWLNGGKELLYRTYSGTTYRVPATGGADPVPVNTLGTRVASLAWSQNRHRLVYSEGMKNSDIWRLDLTAQNAGAKDAAPEPLITSTRREVFPQYSPDGKRLLFYSNRSGSIQIWVSDADGSNAMPLTPPRPGVFGSPRWSPDGRTVVFDSNTTGDYHLYTVSADGGKIRQLTSGRTGEYLGTWSRDGRWIYYTVNSGANIQQLWKLPAQGGTPVQLTQNGGVAAAESPDGKWLYYAKQAGTGSLWKRPLAGGPETQLTDSLFRNNFAITENGVYLTAGSAIDYIDFKTGSRRTIVKTKKPDVGLSLSPDGRYLVWSQEDGTNWDLNLVENFK